MAKKIESGSAFDKISMDQIIGAPLRATANANAMMARTQTSFIMDFCFEEKDGSYQPKMIDMVMTTSAMEPSNDPKGEPKFSKITTTFSLPLLTIIPISSLSVEKFEIDFDMEVTSIERKEDKTGTDGKENSDSPKDSSDQEVSLMGKVSTKSDGARSSNSQYQKKVGSKLSINIKGGHMQLPVGITAILDLYKNNIEPKEISKETPKTNE